MADDNTVTYAKNWPADWLESRENRTLSRRAAAARHARGDSFTVVIGDPDQPHAYVVVGPSPGSYGVHHLDGRLRTAVTIFLTDPDDRVHVVQWHRGPNDEGGESGYVREGGVVMTRKGARSSLWTADHPLVRWRTGTPAFGQYDDLLDTPLSPGRRAEPGAEPAWRDLDGWYLELPAAAPLRERWAALDGPTGPPLKLTAPVMRRAFRAVGIEHAAEDRAHHCELPAGDARVSMVLRARTGTLGPSIRVRTARGLTLLHALPGNLDWPRPVFTAEDQLQAAVQVMRELQVAVAEAVPEELRHA